MSAGVPRLDMGAGKGPRRAKGSSRVCRSSWECCRKTKPPGFPLCVHTLWPITPWEMPHFQSDEQGRTALIKLKTKSFRQLAFKNRCSFLKSHHRSHHLFFKLQLHHANALWGRVAGSWVHSQIILLYHLGELVTRDTCWAPRGRQVSQSGRWLGTFLPYCPPPPATRHTFYTATEP